MMCPKCNGKMAQYVGFNERCAAPGAPWECVKGCVTPTLQTSAQPTQSQQANVATAPTQPAPLNGYGGTLPLPQKKAGTWLPPQQGPGSGSSALRTHQPQGGSHPVGSGTTRHEWSREYLGQWCTTHPSEMSSDKEEIHSLDRMSIPVVYPYRFLKDWSSY